jgi:hypothetical protein
VAAGAVSTISAGTVTDSDPKAGTVAPEAETVSVCPAVKPTPSTESTYWLSVPGAMVVPAAMLPPEIVSVPALTPFVGVAQLV